MTASRTCRACGADLRGDVMWCLRCYAPIRQLTPRDRGEPTITFLRDPDANVERSRWRAGVTTFGPVGRVVTTLLVLALAPWSTNVIALAVMWPSYLVLAAIVLRATWRKDDVVTMTIAEMAAAGHATRAEAARQPFPRSTIVAYGAGAVFVVAAVVMWASSTDDVRAALTICGAVGVFVLTLRWLTKA